MDCLTYIDPLNLEIKFYSENRGPITFGDPETRTFVHGLIKKALEKPIVIFQNPVNSGQKVYCTMDSISNKSYF